MTLRLTLAARVAAAALCSFVAADAVSAQAWAYPALQPPRVVTREFNFGFADAGSAGTSLLFQWREGISARDQWSLDAGLADPDGRGLDNVLFFGGQFAHQLTTSTRDVPLDFLLTVGAGVAIGNNTTLRVPVGVSVGHRFPLSGDLALTPFAHPRVSLDFCGGCKSDEAQLGIAFDLGANLELTPVLAVRGAAFFGGSSRFGDDGLGLSLVWTPPGLRR